MKMNSERRERPTVILQEKQHDIQPTSHARNLLYRLIAHFRKISENADDPRTASIFKFASEVLMSLVNLFKQYEQEVENNQDNP